VAFGVAARAELLGTLVTGVLNSGVDTAHNYYDPANHFVPAGTDNQASPTVTIDSNVEFGFQDPSNVDTADFTDNTLTVTDIVGPAGATDWTQTFTDAAFAGATMSTASDSFNPLLSAATLSGDMITIDWNGTGTDNVTYSATFDFAAPASMALLATGLLGLGVTRRRRRK
jgi:hypothetical protein